MKDSANKIIFSATKKGDRLLFKEILGKALKEGSFKKLSEYPLSKNMTDSQLQEATKSSPVSMTDFLKLVFLLLMEPWRGKKELGYELDKKYGYGYILHVKTSSKKEEILTYAISYYSGMDEWTIRCEDFNKMNMINQGLHGEGWKFLYFNS